MASTKFGPSDASFDKFWALGKPIWGKWTNYYSSVQLQVYTSPWNFIVRKHWCVLNDSETHETVSLDLHDRRSRECHLVTPVKCVSLSSRTHRDVLAFITYIFFSKQNWDSVCLMHLTQQSYLMYFIQIHHFFHCVVESWWNIPSKGTRHGDAVAYINVAMLIWLFSIMTSHSLNTYGDVTTMHEWVMNIH